MGSITPTRSRSGQSLGGRRQNPQKPQSAPPLGFPFLTLGHRVKCAGARPTPEGMGSAKGLTPNGPQTLAS